MEEEEERFSPVDVLWFGSDLSDNSFENSACI
jgi:hypothetical protein